MINFDRWLNLCGGQMSKLYERDHNIITLTFFSDDEEEWLEVMYGRRLKPSEAAIVIYETRRR